MDAILKRALVCLLGAMTGYASNAVADQYYADIDLRGVLSDGERSFLNGGLGELRFDSDHDGARVGSVNLGYEDDVFDIVRVNVDAVAYGDDDRSPIDLTDAYAEIRPFPHSAWRSRVKVGAFYAPISLENRLRGWRSAYSISPSAINTWVGEELRTIGAEYDLEWLGQQSGHNWQFGAVGALYGWNDAAGTLMAKRGWAIHDRQTTLFGQIGEPGTGPVSALHMFGSDIDHRPGYYVGASADYRAALQLQALHYDNLADPAASTASGQYAWHTRFDSVGASWTPVSDWTVISQWLGGDTYVGELPNAWGFRAAFLLASWQHGPDRISARYDLFSMQQTSSSFGFYNSDRGHAWTLSYERDFGKNWSAVLEGLQIDSVLAARDFVGEPPGAIERELQLSLRLAL